MDDFRHTADRAYAAVDVPDSVVDILAELRCYLQDKCEPPMYVSDRRFMKAVQMLQVRRVFGARVILMAGML
jgi:MoxR-like ATPase